MSIDLFQGIRDKLDELIDEYDLYQLSQIGMFMSGPSAFNYVEDDFWTKTMESALSESMNEFQEHQDLIAKDQYLDDFMACLVQFGMREVSSD